MWLNTVLVYEEIGRYVYFFTIVQSTENRNEWNVEVVKML